MRIKYLVFIFLFIFIVELSLSSACPYLKCSNFTNSDKKSDCKYIWASDLSKSEKQEVLCELWKGSYNFNVWQPTNSPPSIPDFSHESPEIENSSLILAGKIIVFLLLNYFIFSLAKSSFLKKWLAADS